MIVCGSAIKVNEMLSSKKSIDAIARKSFVAIGVAADKIEKTNLQMPVMTTFRYKKIQ